VIGGVGYTPKFLKAQIEELKSNLKDKNAPFGVDLLLPKVGGGARKTNKDYTNGQLPELIDIIIESGAKLFVSAVGVPPRWAVDKLHKAGIPCMNVREPYYSLTHSHTHTHTHTDDRSSETRQVCSGSRM
jgi:hypothetical protein